MKIIDLGVVVGLNELGTPSVGVSPLYEYAVPPPHGMNAGYQIARERLKQQGPLKKNPSARSDFMNAYLLPQQVALLNSLAQELGPERMQQLLGIMENVATASAVIAVHTINLLEGETSGSEYRK